MQLTRPQRVRVQQILMVFLRGTKQDAILQMQLRQLTAWKRKKIRQEHDAESADC